MIDYDARRGFHTYSVHSATDKILEAIQAHPEGGTADRTTGAVLTLEDGYLVGGAHPSSVVIWPAARPIGNAFAAVQSVVTAARSGETKKRCVGWWLDNGDIYIEVSQHFTRQFEAEREGRKRGEIAIYDVKNGKDIIL
jgi:hypothetical protein